MTDQTAQSPAPLADQPHAIVERDGVRYTLLGTAHVSRASVDAVHAAIASGEYDAVAVELDPQRLAALTDPDALAQARPGQGDPRRQDGVVRRQPRRSPRTSAASPNNSASNRAPNSRPRCTTRASATCAVHLIDRDVGLTFKRASQRLGWWGRAKLGGGLVAVAVRRRGSRRTTKSRSSSKATCSNRASANSPADSPELYDTRHRRTRPLHGRAPARERDRASGARNVLAVVGAGHLQGLARHLREETRAPGDDPRANWKRCKEKSSLPVVHARSWPSFVLGGFAWGFWRGGLDVGADLMLYWVLITGTLGAIGCAVAGGHPLSIIAAFLASPVTPLHPALASGTISALVEAWVRKPTYADFMALRDDVQSVRGW